MHTIIGFSEEEKNIIQCYLEKNMSIREISEAKKGFGRTKIRNIIERYANLNDETAAEVKLRLYSQKLHRAVSSLDEINQEDLSEEQVILAYRDITENGKTLTEVSAGLDKNRETVKSDIMEYLSGDDEAIKEFKRILKDNQNLRGTHVFKDSMTQEEKLQRIFERLNYRRKISGRKPYSEGLLERKAIRLMSFFEKRNSKIQNEAGKISNNELLRMMYDYPTLLSMSLNNKLRPALMALENNKNVGEVHASKIIKENPGVLGSSIERTKLQLKILSDTKTLRFVFNKPRILRTSPELMYSQIQLWAKEGKYSTPFVSTRKLEELYGKTAKQIQKEFDVESEYGDDEYFDRM